MTKAKKTKKKVGARKGSKKENWKAGIVVGSGHTTEQDDNNKKMLKMAQKQVAEKHDEVGPYAHPPEPVLEPEPEGLLPDPKNPAIDWSPLAKLNLDILLGRKAENATKPLQLTLPKEYMDYIESKGRGWLPDLIRKAIKQDIESHKEYVLEYIKQSKSREI